MNECREFVLAANSVKRGLKHAHCDCSQPWNTKQCGTNRRKVGFGTLTLKCLGEIHLGNLLRVCSRYQMLPWGTDVRK